MQPGVAMEGPRCLALALCNLTTARRLVRTCPGMTTDHQPATSFFGGGDSFGVPLEGDGGDAVPTPDHGPYCIKGMLPTTLTLPRARHASWQLSWILSASPLCLPENSTLFREGVKDLRLVELLRGGDGPFIHGVADAGVVRGMLHEVGLFVWAHGRGGGRLGKRRIRSIRGKGPNDSSATPTRRTAPCPAGVCFKGGASVSKQRGFLEAPEGGKRHLCAGRARAGVRCDTATRDHRGPLAVSRYSPGARYPGLGR